MDVSSSGGGTIETNQDTPSSYPFTLTISSGESVHLEAVPSSGYRFDNWSGSLSGTTNPATIVMSCNKKITANFSQIMHNLTIKVSGNGTTAPMPGDHDYAEGAKVNITANPAGGWQFVEWIGEVSDPTKASTTVTMDSDKTIIASLSNITHILTIRISGSGSTTPSAGSHAYSKGTLVNIEAIPDSGWQFDSWNGDVAAADFTTTIVTMVSDRTLTANFSKAKAGWWPFGGIVTFAIIIGLIIWFVMRSRPA